MVRACFICCLTASFLFLSGCGGVGSKATEDGFKQITLKADTAQVVGLVGEPSRKRTHPQFPSIEIWEYGDQSHVTFDGGKVAAVMWQDRMLVEEALPEDD